VEIYVNNMCVIRKTVEKLSICLVFDKNPQPRKLSNVEKCDKFICSYQLSC